MGHCRAPVWTCRSCPQARGHNALTNQEPEMSTQTVHTVGIIMNGVTGRMGLNQHLRRSIHAIIEHGGVRLSESEVIMPRPLLVGRNPAKLEAIGREFGGLP